MYKINKRELTPQQSQELIYSLQSRFEKNKNRHKGFDWAKTQAQLEVNPEKM